MDKILNVALPKGRLGEKVYDMFEKAGFDCPSIKENNRKLIFENLDKGIRFFWVKPSDVAIYVEHGAADIGVCGKDILLEYSPDVYELLDLKIGKCSMAVAGKKDFSVSLDDEIISIVTIKKADEQEKLIFRLLNNSKTSVNTALTVCGARLPLAFGKYEVKTVTWDGKCLREEAELLI